jgi:hypothetical protein
MPVTPAGRSSNANEYNIGFANRRSKIG